MFSPQTEIEISNNAYAANAGCYVMLSAQAFNELLQAARLGQSYSAGGSSPQHYDPHSTALPVSIQRPPSALEL